jgi:hypothetical protein
VVRQLFRIARHWLDFEEDVRESGDAEIRVASAEKAKKRTSLSKNVAVVPNLTDKSRPLFDTYGRGLQALRSIWLHDATGPIADDALMLTATHHLRKENFVEAARHFSLLREQYPDSPHFKDAFILGSHVALASYEGPSYDPSSLQEALTLKETTLKLFPDLSPEQRSRLEAEVEKLQEAEVARIWELVEFYDRKGLPESMALHCYLILNRYPESRYAQLARAKLFDIEPELRAAGKGGNFWNLNRSPQPAKEEAKPEQDSGSRMTLPAESDSRQAEVPAGSDPNTPKKRSMFGFLRRAESPPELQPAPTSPEGSPGKVSL